MRVERSCRRWRSGGRRISDRAGRRARQPVTGGRSGQPRAGRADSSRGRRRRLVLGQPSRRPVWPCRSCRPMFAGASCSRARTRCRSRAYADFSRKGSDWPSLGTLQARAEEAMDATVSVERAARLLRDPRAADPAGADRSTPRRCSRPAGDARGRGAAAAEPGSRTISARTEEPLFLDRFGADLQPPDDAARLDRLLWDGRTDQARRMLPRVRAPNARPVPRG